MGGVLSQINQGEGITASLKHVEKSQMTHKNPALRGDHPQKKLSPPPPAKPIALQRSSSGRNLNETATAPVKKPGVKRLDGVKWFIVRFLLFFFFFFFCLFVYFGSIVCGFVDADVGVWLGEL
jgi:adenylyl cyclase-associated protein